MRKVLFFMFIVLSFCGYSQRIQNFHVFASGANVGVRFTITQGPQCSGYTIYHSTDSINFIQIYDFPGVCGDQNSNQEYSYTHTAPALNQVNYYKVTIFPTENSNIERIYVSNQPKASMLAYPNPVVLTYDVLNLRIFNLSNTRLAGFLYNQFGKPLRTLDLTTTADLASLPVYDLTNGLYVIWLTDGSQAFSSKFVINR